MQVSAEHSFWCWKHKLQGILQLLSFLSGYAYSEADADAVAYGLHTTDTDQRRVLPYDLSGINGQCRVELALDADDRDIVFITTTASGALQERIVFLSQVQEVLKTIEVNFT
ncbi:hypothetical protein [Hymenobacter metallicola]|uniref:Uncharacterized protein n=1 Tax=Hymenobacter metallicola TaxID=2563114 RepID=A0A4Z0QGE1_9BACT|nr:hypothetical protein [Hymenobacter metallicola]TGE28101.1 hypothetical protein E5K02_01145 [Hymenobacter metallicola]